MTKSVADDVGRLILSGVVLTKVLKEIERLKDIVEHGLRDDETKLDSESRDLEEEYLGCEDDGEEGNYDD